MYAHARFDDLDLDLENVCKARHSCFLTEVLIMLLLNPPKPARKVRRRAVLYAHVRFNDLDFDLFENVCKPRPTCFLTEVLITCYF